MVCICVWSCTINEINKFWGTGKIYSLDICDEMSSIHNCFFWIIFSSISLYETQPYHNPLSPSIVTLAVEMSKEEKQWSLAQCSGQELPQWEEMPHSACSMWMGHFDWAKNRLSVFLNPTPCFPCVFDPFLLWLYSKISICVCSVKQSSWSMVYCLCGQVCVCVCVLQAP